MNASFGLGAETLSRSLAAATPLLLGTLGEITAERSGVLNLGVEGMMAAGAVAGFSAAHATGSPWIGLAAAVGAGAALALVHAFFSVTLKANQIVCGIALTMLGLGISGVWGRAFVGAPLECRFQAVLWSRDPVFYLAVVLTAALTPAGIDGQKVVAELRKKGIWIAGGQAEAKGKIFRIAHMGFIDTVDLLGTIGGLEEVLNTLGYKVQPGVGLKAAQEVLAKEAAV